jgi:hypothetical protein
VGFLVGVLVTIAVGFIVGTLVLTAGAASVKVLVIFTGVLLRLQPAQRETGSPLDGITSVFELAVNDVTYVRVPPQPVPVPVNAALFA